MIKEVLQVCHNMESIWKTPCRLRTLYNVKSQIYPVVQNVILIISVHFLIYLDTAISVSLELVHFNPILIHCHLISLTFIAMSSTWSTWSSNSILPPPSTFNQPMKQYHGGDAMLQSERVMASNPQSQGNHHPSPNMTLPTNAPICDESNLL